MLRCSPLWSLLRHSFGWSLLWVKITHSPENEMCIASQWNTRVSRWNNEKCTEKKHLLTKLHNFSVAFGLNSKGNSLVPGSDKTQVAPNKCIMLVSSEVCVNLYASIAPPPPTKQNKNKTIKSSKWSVFFPLSVKCFLNYSQ